MTGPWRATTFGPTAFARNNTSSHSPSPLASYSFIAASYFTWPIGEEEDCVRLNVFEPIVSLDQMPFYQVSLIINFGVTYAANSTNIGSYSYKILLLMWPLKHGSAFSTCWNSHYYAPSPLFDSFRLVSKTREILFYYIVSEFIQSVFVTNHFSLNVCPCLSLDSMLRFVMFVSSHPNFIFSEIKYIDILF